ncbi:hypothetical protein M011DRAFT_460217 [Sporormia fimetaria CBS 119925]|uniref:Zn(2)-C6 fungal-type domain-containing protein n=1 Tax=Sporormia fimetaria CBS 119925 TaxID=1340428 RepID=A0A6A6V6H8_9PLEO|nr:hypothetical protein M011DRAFT_460217 [Sporormia fimetaria CBS 119925]
MSPPGAEDASPSSDYSEDPDGNDMAELKTENNADDADRSQKPANGKTSSTPKDTLRPRRKKARRACIACQRAHLTCGDERPCKRCVQRGLPAQGCVDGMRKKAKYLHDAPDSALQPPGYSNAIARLNGNHQHPLGAQDLGSIPLPQQNGFFGHQPSNTYYAQNGNQAQIPMPTQDASATPFHNTQPPNVPAPFNQGNQTVMTNASAPPSHGTSAQVQQNQFGSALFDPSDPALFNFDISSLNFGNHYGALEMGMLGHMSSGAADAHHDKNMMESLNAAQLYNQQLPYGESHMRGALNFDPNSMSAADWQQHAHSRHNSLQTKTPNNTPITATLDHFNQRHDSLQGPHAFAIGQGPSSLSSASPASTEVNTAYDTDNTMSGATFFHNSGQHQIHQASPAVQRQQQPQQENRMPGSALQPIPPNVIRKRRRDTKAIYEGVRKPHDYVAAFHRMRAVFERRYPKASLDKVRSSMAKYRPALITAAGSLQHEDLVHQERELQLCLAQIDESFSEVGVPSVVCRRSGEVVWMNKEFSILTGWEREVLLGRQPNLNVNTGVTRDPNSVDSTRTNNTPVIAGQPDPATNGTGTLNPVLIVELMDERSGVEYLDDFAEAAYLNSRGTPRRRVNMLRYMTREDVLRSEQEASQNAMHGKHNGNGRSDSPLVKLDNGVIQQGEKMSKLSKNGLVDCMIQWHVKRDDFDMPMLVCMHVMPVLDRTDSQPSKGGER